MTQKDYTKKPRQTIDGLPVVSEETGCGTLFLN